jgi:hypothetical protein
MATRGNLISWKEVKAMLDACAPGWRYVDKTHKRWVYFRDLPDAFRLPLGKHGRRENPEIQPGHVKGLARYFGVYECAKRYFRW